MSPTNFSIKDASTYGSADIQAVKIDREGYFVQRSKKRAYVLAYSVEANDYVSQEISRYNPTVLNAGVKRVAVQRIPDTRIWNVMGDGSVVCLTYEKSEDVIAWSTFETDGEVEDIVVLPNTEGDDVYFIINRTIDGSTKRYRERLTYDTDALGGVNNYVSDCFKEQTVTASATVTGLSHLEDKDVVVWAAGEPLLDDDLNPATFTVASGQITLPEAVTGNVIVGLPYEGRWKSTKLAYAAQTGTAMSQRKNITQVAPILYATHNKAVLFGQNFTDNMDPVNQVFEMEDLGAAMLDTDRDYDYDAFTLPGDWSPDARVCMKFRSPLPATVLGLGLSIESHENA